MVRFRAIHRGVSVCSMFVHGSCIAYTFVPQVPALVWRARPHTTWHMAHELQRLTGICIQSLECAL